MTTDLVSEYDSQLSQLNARLKPFDQIVTTRHENENRPNPMDDLGVRTEATRLMTAVTELYASTPESRGRIRDMFGRYRYVRWALWPREQPTNEEIFRLHLLGISMRDVGDDPRDMPLLLAHICKTAISAGVNVGPILESVAAISSDQKQYDWPSMREMILVAKRRFSSE